MTEQDYATARRLLVRVAGLLYDRRLTELQGGNMSLRVGDAVVLTPTKASEETGWRLSPEDTLVQDLSGHVLVGDPARISREIRLHLRLYNAFPELGSVFHLHLPEALAAVAAGRWAPGVVTASPDEFGAALVVLEPDLPAQTEPHDGRVVELLGQVSRIEGAISISPGHGIFSVARDVPTNVRAADVFRQRMEIERLRGRLRSARMQGRA
jgi:ribulose-5-phosphate 4-epimerase/fuculose-1-phosphate aldolase